jgi:hypothetical protein
MNQLRLTRKRRKINFHLTETLLQFREHKLASENEPVYFKVFLVEFSSKFFYTFVHNIYVDCHFARLVNQIFFNYIHGFVGYSSGRATCDENTSISIVLDQKFFKHFCEFINIMREHKNVANIYNGNTCLKLTGINLTDHLSTDRSG